MESPTSRQSKVAPGLMPNLSRNRFGITVCPLVATVLVMRERFTLSPPIQPSFAVLVCLREAARFSNRGAFCKTALAPNSTARRLCSLGDVMTIIKQGVQTLDMKREVREFRATARKIGASKESARRFLLSTGLYSPNGRLKPQFR